MANTQYYDKLFIMSRMTIIIYLKYVAINLNIIPNCNLCLWINHRYRSRLVFRLIIGYIFTTKKHEWFVKTFGRRQ